MSTDNNIWMLAEAYLSGKMPKDELNQLQHRIATEKEFANSFHESVNLIRAMDGNGAQQRFRAMLADVQQNRPVKRVISLRTHYWRAAAVAASIALVTSIGTYWGMTASNKKNTSEYNLLRRDLDNIRRSQNQLRQDFSRSKTPAVQPAAPVRYTGTCFALTANGYFVTNYHVTDGADSVYIQNHDGAYFKVAVIAGDPTNDIAILKVADKGFHLNKGDVPYIFSNTKADLGGRVYTLGYPEDDIVYNEGYVSGRNGYENDSMQYRLDLPADFGQSGSPIMDGNGEVLAVLTGIGKEGAGITYAVSSEAVIQLAKSLPNIHLPRINKLEDLSREQQIQKMEYYTCSVKVYKK